MTRSAAPPESWLSAFELGERLATASLTVVHRATRRSDQQALLIKSVKPGQRSNERALAALQHERDVVRAVAHPSLPVLVEVAQSEDRKHLALIYADPQGHRLVHVLDRTARIAPLSVVAIAIELSSAIGAIHRAGFIHGRLRREAIEIVEVGKVFLHDTGASASGTGVSEADLESPEHMAPEQILGHATRAETDVFLLGVLLYEMLTGAPPFGNAGGVTQQIRHVEPPSILERAPDAPRQLQRIIMRCLRKRPRDRYPDVASLESELVRVLRSHTALPIDVLVSRALAGAGLGDALPPPRERGVDRAVSNAPPWLRSAILGVGAAAVLGAAITGGWALIGDSDTAAGAGVQGIVKRPARLRVLARPWAEIHIDGELVEITPVGHPIEVSPGRHVVIFKHPNAPDVSREVEIIAGQTILLDVDMDITRPSDAGAADADLDDQTP